MRNLLLVLVAVSAIVLMGIFAALNPGVVTLDLAWTAVDVQVSTALAIAFAGGWLFGMLCAAIWALQLYRDRRRLRKSLGLAEAEVNNLRSLPLEDAH